MIGINARGPFLLLVQRPGNKAGFHKSEWLTGEVEKSEVESEAQALLTDPRDTIEAVNVWSLKDQQFVGGYRHGNIA